ncbi:MAG: hypothetical protein ACLR1K_01960 [Oscillospiraceae bacterium]
MSLSRRLPQLDSRWQESPTAKVLAVTACPTGIAHTYGEPTLWSGRGSVWVSR